MARATWLVSCAPLLVAACNPAARTSQATPPVHADSEPPPDGPVPSRAQALLDLCDVLQSPPYEDGGPPVFACDPESFGTPSRSHALRLARDVSTGYPDVGVDVRGSFLAAGSDERLVVLGGETNGSSGGTSGFLFLHAGGAWKLEKTFVSFPATSCVALPRPARPSRLLCAFSNTWQSLTNVWAALFDLGMPLEEDMNARPPTEQKGFLRPVQVMMHMGDEEAAAAVHNCPDSTERTGLLPPAPLHVAAAPGGATLTLRVNSASLADARARACQPGGTDAPTWPTHDVTYRLSWRDDRLVVSGPHAAEDAELERLVMVPPR